MSKQGKYDFELSFFEGIYRRMPSDIRVVSILAHLYTQTGQIDSGLKMDRRLVRLTPSDPTAYYNLACSLALKERKTDAVKALRDAVTYGYSDFHWMCNDPDLEVLSSYVGFKKLLADLGIG